MRVFVWICLALAGCRGAHVDGADAAPPTPIPAPTRTPTPTPSPTPTSITGFFEALPVLGHPDAWLSLPTGATSKRPVVVVIHGAGDRPDWQCGGWRRATREYPFIVCPRGAFAPGDSTKDDQRYTHTGGPALVAHIDAALDALVAKYPDYADASQPLLAGFSLGSYEVFQIAVKQSSRFPRVVLVEGLTDGLDDARARKFVAGGGLRVLFGCGQRGCAAAAKATAARLVARDHLDARSVFAPVGHTFDPPLEDAIEGEMGWLVADDPRWNAATF